MTLENFINGYKITTKDKSEYLKKHIVNIYVPWATKVAEAKTIIELTQYVETTLPNGEKRKSFQRNTPYQFLMFLMRILVHYTDLEFENDKLVEVYDALKENDILEELIKLIPQNEYKEFQTILSMQLADVMENERSVVGFLQGKIDILSLLASQLNENENE